MLVLSLGGTVSGDMRSPIYTLSQGGSLDYGIMYRASPRICSP